MPIKTTRPEPAKLGLGYRELRVGEEKQAGDEFSLGTLPDWLPIPENQVGRHIYETSVRHRRKIEQARKAA